MTAFSLSARDLERIVACMDVTIPILLAADDPRALPEAVGLMELHARLTAFLDAASGDASEATGKVVH